MARRVVSRVLGGHWGDCDPSNPRNRRSRCSLLIERFDAHNTTRVLIDTSPDMRAQLLAANIGELDAVVYTHSHADHVHGIDDLRMLVINRRERLNVWADAATQVALLARFGYVFERPEGSSYPPILEMNTIDGDVSITGAGGIINLSPFDVRHGSIDALGFRIGPLAYLPDVSEMNDAAWQHVTGIDCWVLDALRREPHPTHTHLEQSLAWIERAGCKRAVLTDMHTDLDYETVAAETPSHVEPAFDGMTLRFQI